MNGESFQCGFVAIIGRPNVGKSTLVNAIVGEKVSIATHKPQTTRHRILGIKTTEEYQMALVDTPGFHLNAKQAINRYMNRAALSALHGVDLLIFVTEVGRWTDEEKGLIEKLEGNEIPVLAVINKIDTLSNKQQLLPALAELQNKYKFVEIIPVSAKSSEGITELEAVMSKHLPVGPPLYAEDQYTDKSIRFVAAELIREQLYLILQQELPYAIAVEIEAFEEEEKMYRIAGIIWVARPSHKSIAIGKSGGTLKKIGRAARLDMERCFGKKVFLNLWVKVKDDWNDNDRALQSLGYLDSD